MLYSNVLFTLLCTVCCDNTFDSGLLCKTDLELADLWNLGSTYALTDTIKRSVFLLCNVLLLPELYLLSNFVYLFAQFI